MKNRLHLESTVFGVILLMGMGSQNGYISNVTI